MAAMTLRVQEIPKQLFDEGTPIYLSLGGSNSIEWAGKMNQKGFKGNLKFVNHGNYCTVGKGEALFESIFNSKTLELLGIEKVD